MSAMKISIDDLKNKADWVRKETLKLHKLAPGTRIASSLSPIEIFVVLYYGKILKIDPKNIFAEDRDRFIISKAHGSVSLYPILADLGFFDKSELGKICQDGAFLGSIPDPIVPGYETINGSLGHGLGVSCGIAVGLKAKGSDKLVHVLMGDGEFYEGSVWEAIMFASEHKLDNLISIVDFNKACMLDYCKNIIDLEPFHEKLKVFGWDVFRIDGHNITELYETLINMKNMKNGNPKLIIADTVKGKGVASLENDPLCHIKILSKDEINILLSEVE